VVSVVGELRPARIRKGVFIQPYGVKQMKRLLVLAAVLAMWMNNAGAAIIVSLDSVGLESPGVFRWTYRAELQPDQTMVANDFFTIYDVPSFLTASFSTSLSNALVGRSFTTTIQASGFNAPGTTLAADDDPLVDNITVRLTGGGTIDPADDAGPGPVTLGNLFVTSTSDRDLTILTDYGSQNHVGGNLASNVGKVVVPAVIPEPGSVTLMMVGLIAVGALAFRRRQTD